MPISRNGTEGVMAASASGAMGTVKRTLEPRSLVTTISPGRTSWPLRAGSALRASR